MYGGNAYTPPTFRSHISRGIRIIILQLLLLLLLLTYLETSVLLEYKTRTHPVGHAIFQQQGAAKNERN